MREQQPATDSQEPASSIRIIRIMPPKEDFKRLPASKKRPPQEIEALGRELFGELDADELRRQAKEAVELLRQERERPR